MITRFFDIEVRPPQGGWSFPIGGVLVHKNSESEILEEMRRYKVNNGTYVSEEQDRAEIWEYFCGREPDRCGRHGVTSTLGTPANPSQLVVADKTPALQGPPIWTFLNTLAAQWSPGLHDYFLATCDVILVVLECPNCREEWRRLLGMYPPAALGSRLQVCRWVNLVHNEVNARKGKQPYPYEKMVTEFGAPLP